MRTEKEKVLFTQATIFQVLPEKQVGSLLKANATPTVENVEVWKAVNTGAFNVTNFKFGGIAQRIHILGDGFTTVIYNVNKIITNTGVDKLLAANKVYRFTLINEVWYEDA